MVCPRAFAHRLQADGHFSAKPTAKKKISTGVSFDTFRLTGFNPPIGIDVNSDGFIDVITSADSKGIEIFLGGPGWMGSDLRNALKSNC